MSAGQKEGATQIVKDWLEESKTKKIQRNNLWIIIVYQV